MASIARQALPVAVQRWRDSKGEEGEPGDAFLKAQSLAAEEILGTMGELKGLALKMGQMMSYMDGALPESVKPAFQRSLKRLQSQAPALSWEAVEPVLLEELCDLDKHFSQIDHEPVAAASIGQVHRATLLDGTEVAVKIQYPGVYEAINADMKNLNFMKGLAAPMLALSGGSSSLKVAGTHFTELRDRLLEECDYEREAQMQATFRERLADDPVLYVPKVYLEHSGRRVLVSEFVRGRALDDVCSDHVDQSVRNTWAAALCRVMSLGLYEWGLLHADPHPGNYLFMEDDRLCMLDFGCVKDMPEPIRHVMRGYVHAAVVATRTQDAGDWAEFDQKLKVALKFEDAEPEVFNFMRDYLLYCLKPIIEPGPFHFDEAYTRGTVDLMVEGKRELLFPDGRRLPKMPKLPPMPADYLMVNRLQWGFFSILKQLDAKVDWHAELPAAMRA